MFIYFFERLLFHNEEYDCSYLVNLGEMLKVYIEEGELFMKKKMIGISAGIIAVLFLYGCSSNNEQKVDESLLHYEADYSTLKNSMASAISVTDINKGVLLFPSFQDDKGAHQYAVFHDEKNLQILDSDPESGCSFDNLEKCSSVSDKTRFNYYTYGDKLYYFEENLDKDDSVIETIKRSNFDGSDEESLCSVKKGNKDDSISFSFTIHKNILYHVEQNKIHAYDLGNNEDKISFEFDDKTVISNLFFEDDTIYITSELYQNGEEVIRNVILKGSLSDHKAEVWMKEKDVYYVCSDFLIELGHDDEDGSVYYYDIASKERKKLLDSYSYSAFVTDKNIVLCDIDLKNLYLFDRNGELLDKTVCVNEEGQPQGIMHQDFYFASDSKFYIYPIENNKFKEAEELKLK